MQDILSREYYTDREDYAVMTRTKVVKDVQLFKIAGHLCRNAEEIASSTNPPSVDNCRIAGMMLGYAHSLAPLRIQTKFDY